MYAGIDTANKLLCHELQKKYYLFFGLYRLFKIEHFQDKQI